MRTVPETMTVTLAMTPEVRALFNETIRLHAEIAGELGTVADDLAKSVAQWKPGEYCAEIVNGANYAVIRIRELAAKLSDAEGSAPGGTDGNP